MSVGGGTGARAMPEQPSDLEQIFTEAVARPTAAERRAYLDQACGADAALRRRVETLLAAHDAADRLLPLTAALDDDPIRAANADAPGQMIGPYKLLQPIGEGGFGVVFMAEQATPVRRRVALKIIKLG